MTQLVYPCDRILSRKSAYTSSFLEAVASTALQQTPKDLNTAYESFCEKRGNHPKCKSMHDNHQYYRTVSQGGNIRIEGKYIKLPKLGYLRIKQSRAVDRHIYNVTVKLRRHQRLVLLKAAGIQSTVVRKRRRQSTDLLPELSDVYRVRTQKPVSKES